MTAPRVAAVVPVHNRVALTRRFLEAFREVDYPACRIVVVDDGSRDGTSDVLARDYPHVHVLRGTGNLWWSGATNLGVRWALDNGSDYVLTINDDTVVRPDFLSRLVACAESNPRTIVGCRVNMMEEPSRVWAAGGRVLWHEGEMFTVHAHQQSEAAVLASEPNPLPADILTGCGTLVPAGCYRRVGLYDARNCPQYHGDTEFVLRAARHGWRALVALDAVVMNDAKKTWKLRGPIDMLCHRRSPWYWRASLAICLRYCPPQYLLQVLYRQSLRVLGVLRRRVPQPLSLRISTGPARS